MNPSAESALCRTVKRIVLGPLLRMDDQTKSAVEGRATPVAPVETKREFIEVGGKMVGKYRTFVRPQRASASGC